MWRPVLVAERALLSADDCGPSASSLSPAGCNVICASTPLSEILNSGHRIESGNSPSVDVATYANERLPCCAST